MKKLFTCAVILAGVSFPLLSQAGGMGPPVPLPVEMGGTNLATTTINQILYSSAGKVIAGLPTGNSGVLITSGGGIPSISTDIPTAITIGTGYIYRVGGTDVALADGGLNASLVASNGGIFYSTATAGAVLAGTATANQMLLSGLSTTPAWSTATWPATTTINQLLYSSAANAVAGLATANSGVLVTSGAGVPSVGTDIPTGVTIGGGAIYRAGGADVAVADGGTALSSVPTNGQLLIGNGTNYTLAALAGTANQLVVTNGAGSITLSTPQDTHTAATPQFARLGLGVAADSTYGLKVAGTTQTTGARIINAVVKTNADTPYSLAAADEVVFVDATSGNVTVNIAAPVVGRVIKIVRHLSGANTITLDPVDSPAVTINQGTGNKTLGAAVGFTVDCAGATTLEWVCTSVSPL